MIHISSSGIIEKLRSISFLITVSAVPNGSPKFFGFRSKELDFPEFLKKKTNKQVQDS